MEPVGHGEDGAVGEGLADGGLYEVVSANVHRGSGLVEKEDAVTAEEGPGKAGMEGNLQCDAQC